VIYAAMPGLWVLGVEALRFLIKLWRNGPGKRPDRIPSGRWIANPFTAAAMQRRMWLLGETSWARMSLIEDARRYALDLIGAARKQGRDIPDLLRSRAKSGRLPEAVMARVDSALSFGGNAGIEGEVQSWVASLIVLPELVSADLQAARVKASVTSPGPTLSVEPATSVEPSREVTPRTSVRRTTQRTPDYTKRPTKAAVAKMPAADLANYVAEWARAGNQPTVSGAMKWFHVGEAKAKAALTAAGLWGSDAEVVLLGASSARA
jgi:hypothetical protein